MSIIPGSARRRPGGWNAVAMLLLLAGCQRLEYSCVREEGASAAVSEAPAPSVVVVAVDGFRYDYRRWADTPALDEIESSGLVVDILKPVFPTETAPNFTSMVTGVHPETHGALGNVFLDPTHDAIFIRGEHLPAPPGERWNLAEPIWESMRARGLTSASIGWPRVDINSGVPGPDIQCSGRPWSGERWKIEKALRLLDNCSDRRPNLVLLHLPMVDAAGHQHGPSGPELGRAISQADRLLGRLLQGLGSTSMSSRTHVLVVSDHGMARRDDRPPIELNDYLDLSEWRLITSGAYSTLWRREAEFRELTSGLKRLRDDDLPVRVYAGDQIPRHLRYRGSSRSPDVLIVADEGAVVGLQEDVGHSGRGLHGYEPSVPSMWATMLATGPRILEGSHVPKASVVDVHALMGRLLGLELRHSIDGSVELFEQSLCPVRCRQSSLP